jgi:hypothetical protein
MNLVVVFMASALSVRGLAHPDAATVFQYSSVINENPNEKAFVPGRRENGRQRGEKRGKTGVEYRGNGEFAFGTPCRGDDSSLLILAVFPERKRVLP